MESDSERSEHSIASTNSSYEVEDYSPPSSPEAGDNSDGRAGPQPYQFEPRAQQAEAGAAAAETGAAAAETGAMLNRMGAVTEW